MKSHGYKVTDFWDKTILKVEFNHTCFAVITLDSALKKHDNYHLLLFLKDSKYIEGKVVRHIINKIKSSCEDSVDFDEE